MAISLRRLRESAQRPRTTVAKSLAEARELGIKTAFLCHSHSDHDLVFGLVREFSEAGWRVYVDWMDSSLPEKPDRQTATKIKDRIRTANFFIFLATPNSVESRWCPWEIGYADGVKPIDTIFVVPTEDGAGTYGNEYLDLYRRIDVSSQGPLASWMPRDSDNGTYVSNL